MKYRGLMIGITVLMLGLIANTACGTITDDLVPLGNMSVQLDLGVVLDDGAPFSTDVTYVFVMKNDQNTYDYYFVIDGSWFSTTGIQEGPDAIDPLGHSLDGGWHDGYDIPIWFGEVLDDEASS